MNAKCYLDGVLPVYRVFHRGEIDGQLRKGDVGRGERGAGIEFQCWKCVLACGVLLGR